MTEPPASEAANASQIEYWNTGPGAKWLGYQDVLDATFAAVKARLLARAAVAAGEHVLEIGCGTGATTLDLAAGTGAGGRVLGVDVARPLLERARTRAAQAGLHHAEFVLADAQTHAFEGAAFDLVTSRFGVMFFEDPVAAFANIAAALRPGGRVAFVSWAALERNPWFAIPREAAIERLGEPAPVPPDAPGPMAFQDTARVTDILTRAGLSQVSAAVEEIPLSVPGSVSEAAAFATNLGPASRIIAERDGSEDDRAAIARTLEDRLRGYMTAEGCRVPATFNFYAAVKT